MQDDQGFQNILKYGTDWTSDAENFNPDYPDVQEARKRGLEMKDYTYATDEWNKAKEYCRSRKFKRDVILAYDPSYLQRAEFGSYECYKCEKDFKEAVEAFIVVHWDL